MIGVEGRRKPKVAVSHDRQHSDGETDEDEAAEQACAAQNLARSAVLGLSSQADGRCEPHLRLLCQSRCATAHERSVRAHKESTWKSASQRRGGIGVFASAISSMAASRALREARVRPTY